MNTTSLGPQQDACLVFRLQDTERKFMLLETDKKFIFSRLLLLYCKARSCVHFFFSFSL